jgi:hypothetical protein
MLGGLGVGLGLTVALISAAGVIVAAIVGALLTQKLRHREISDKDQFRDWREAFDRAAFKGPYLWNSDPKPFLKAITDTIRAVNTGARYDGDRLISSGKGKARIRNPRWRSEMDDIERELSYIRRSVDEAIRSDAGEPSYMTAHLDPSLAEHMDKARDDVISRLNAIWSDLRIPVLPVPTTVTDFSTEPPEGDP